MKVTFHEECFAICLSVKKSRDLFCVFMQIFAFSMFYTKIEYLVTQNKYYSLPLTIVMTSVIFGYFVTLCQNRITKCK